MRSPKRTKLETEQGRTPIAKDVWHYHATVREVYVDSGKVRRILVKLDARDQQSLDAQLTGALAAILESRRAAEKQEPRRLMDWPSKQFKFWNLNQVVTKRDLIAFVSEMRGIPMKYLRKQDKTKLIEQAIEAVSCAECTELIEPTEVTEAGICRDCEEKIEAEQAEAEVA